MLAWKFTTVIATQKGIVLMVVASFDASNLADVVRALRVQHLVWLIMVAGDNYHRLPQRDPPLAGTNGKAFWYA